MLDVSVKTRLFCMKNLFDNLKSFFSVPSYSRTLALVALLILIISLPITVVFLEQHTTFFQHAAVVNDGGGSCTEGDCSSIASTCNYTNHTRVFTCFHSNCTTYTKTTQNIGDCGYTQTDTCTNSVPGAKCAPQRKDCSYLGDY